MRYSKKVAQRVIEGKAFVLDTKARDLHSLNPTATLIWELAGRGLDKEDIWRAVAEEFEVDPAEARADAREFLDTLKSKGLLEE